MNFIIFVIKIQMELSKFFNDILGPKCLIIFVKEI